MEKMEINELVDYLLNSKIKQTSYQFEEEESLSESVWSTFNENAVKLMSDLNTDKHRWYEIATSVYKIGDSILGITGVSSLYTESSVLSDVADNWKIELYEEIKTISYRKKTI